MIIADLTDGIRRVDIKAKVVDITESREVRSRYSGETFTVAEAMISDDIGTFKLVL